MIFFHAYEFWLLKNTKKLSYKKWVQKQVWYLYAFAIVAHFSVHRSPPPIFGVLIEMDALWRIFFCGEGKPPPSIVVPKLLSFNLFFQLNNFLTMESLSGK